MIGSFLVIIKRNNTFVQRRLFLPSVEKSLFLIRNYVCSGCRTLSRIPGGGGALGSIRNRKPSLKKHPQPRNRKKKFSQNRKPHAKPINFNIPVIKSLIVRCSGELWSIKRFRGYSRSVEANNGRSDLIQIGTQRGKTENHIGYQIRKLISIFDENRKSSAK